MSSKNLKRLLSTLLEYEKAVGNYTTSTIRGVTSGAPGFGGGPYGFGDEEQLAGPLNPATQAIKDQEEDEKDQNVVDQMWSLGKYVVGSGPVAKMDYKSTTSVPLPLDELAAMDTAVSRMRDLPGFPRMNTLVNQQPHTPQTKEEDDYLGPTLNGKPLDDGSQTNPLLEELIRGIVKEIMTNWRLPNPIKRGWNNTTVNSLAIRRNHLDPDQPPLETFRGIFREPEGHYPELQKAGKPAMKSAGGGFGAIGYPKQFVPTDWEQTQRADEGDLDNILGQKRLQSSPSPTPPRVGTNTSVKEQIKAKKK